jgi:hypothetical protein
MEVFMSESVSAQFIIVVGITVFLVIRGFILVLQLKKLSLEKHLMKNDLYQELLNEQREAVKIVFSELTGLKEKVNSIEKILKEVE